MSDNIIILAENDIKPGQLDTLKALLSEINDSIAREEPGTHNYEWFISDDGKSAHVYERYADSEACVAHLMNLGANKYAERLFNCLGVTKIAIYGNPSDAIRGIFANYPTVYLSPLTGYAR